MPAEYLPHGDATGETILIVEDEAEGKVYFNTKVDMAEGLAEFYQKFLDEDMDFFALTPARYRKRHCKKWPGVLLVTLWWLITVELLPDEAAVPLPPEYQEMTHNLGDLLDDLLSVESVGVFKPHPSVYDLVGDFADLGIPAAASPVGVTQTAGDVDLGLGKKLF